MTKLNVQWKTVCNNADQCCCRGSILVDGHGARDAEGTCCASFEENKGGSFKNLFKTPETRLR